MAGTSSSKNGETNMEVDEDPPKEEAVKAIQYPPPSKSADILDKMHASREHGEFCDIQLKISSLKTVYAHKALLANCSQYFEGMFSSQFMEATSDVIDLSHMCDRSDVLEKVLDTFYGRSFEINETNVSDALNLATMLMLEDLKVECRKVLFGVLSLYNAAEMLQLAINFDMQDLQEKVEPIIYARFNDYIIFQEDLYDLSVEGFDRLTDIIETKFITRRERYVQFLFKWFNLCESEERAQLLLKAINKINFKLTKHSYVEYKDQLEDILNNLDDVNTDMSEQTKVELSSKLLDLIPADYVQNIPLSPDSCNSDVEPEPEFEMYPQFPESELIKNFGPPTREVGFTPKELEAWEKAHVEMAERDSMRELAEKWPRHTFKDPNRPKGLRIRYESPPPVRRNRVLPKKSEDEQKRLDDLVDVVVVLTPSASYLDRLQNPPPKPKKKSYEAEVEPDDNMLAVCVYVPCTRGWYKITELNTTCIKNAFGGSGSSGGGEGSGSSRRRRDGPFPDDFDDEEEVMMMMGMPEMMLFDDMPHSYRMMKEMSRSGMPHRMIRRMMEMDPDSRHGHRMMREMARRHRRFGGPDMMMFEHMGRLMKKIPSLTDKKWKVQYFMDKLFFFHEELLYYIFVYDLLTKEWKQTHVEYRSLKPERDYFDLVDGLDLIVIDKETMYAVHRVALIENREDYSYKRYDERVDAAKKQTLMVKHVIYKLVFTGGEKKDMRWERHMETEKHYAFIDVDEEHREKIDKDDDRGGFYHNPVPRLKQPNCLETALFAEDPLKLDIVLMSHNRYNYKNKKLPRSVCTIEACYLDSKEKEELRDGQYSFVFGRTVTPLVSSDYCIFTSDMLEPVASIDLAHGSNKCSWGAGPYNHEKGASSPYLDALEQYPRCPTTMCSANDGKRLWILRGKEDDSSELIEVQIKCCRQFRLYQSEYVQTPHTPPPFKCFTLATTGSMDIARVKGFGLPLKYMHGRQNVL